MKKSNSIIITLVVFLTISNIFFTFRFWNNPLNNFKNLDEFNIDNSGHWVLNEIFIDEIYKRE